MALKQKTLIGVDVGSSTLQMVNTNGKGRITRAISYELPEGIVTKMQIGTPELLINAIKSAKRAGRISGSKCVLSIGGSDVVIRHLLLPFMNDVQIYENIINEISSYLPVNTENYSIDYSVQEEIIVEGASQIQVMVVAIPKELLKTYIDCFHKAGIKITTIDITENSQGKLMRHLIPKFNDPIDNFGIIDIGAEITNITSYLNGHFFVNKVANIGGTTLTNDLAQALATDYLSAELAKASDDYFDSDISTRTIVCEYADQIIFEAGRVFDYFQSRTQETIERVFLCGGGALLPGLAEYIQTNIGFEVLTFEEILSPLFTRRPIVPNASIYAAAIGATFREV